MRIRLSQVAFFIALIASINLRTASAGGADTPLVGAPDTAIRDPHSPGYVAAQELPDGTIPRSDADGNFIIGPTHKRAAEMTHRCLDGTA